MKKHLILLLIWLLLSLVLITSIKLSGVPLEVLAYLTAAALAFPPSALIYWLARLPEDRYIAFLAWASIFITTTSGFAIIGALIGWGVSEFIPGIELSSFFTCGAIVGLSISVHEFFSGKNKAVKI
ncbi:hypothetical protein Q1Z72_01630 [Pseudomonas qingdaonensis]|uniref:hypothetical protein n=1 Tax=Pseudomonas TaxID=286 RepID=UPI0021174D4F|nr:MULTISPECIES: hypothetical protein [Pseudomonas]UXH55900.1 hypothetical protein N5876_32655 [Pseudomonas aeruginosa]UXH68944.1 hypothetical protein N5879_32780 [Pseudomonas aeruginosa]WKL67396.1 hypothetical protein Q1Z72_01630 [Pseudomonas qingdaonensis]